MFPPLQQGLRPARPGMIATGVYWISLYELLESRGFTARLVNARHVKNVSECKSDVLDCKMITEVEVESSRFKSAKHFAS